jgi:FkbM family methyltransferase
MKKINLIDYKKNQFTLFGNINDQSIIGSIVNNSGRYENHVMKIMAEIIKPNFNCIDIGANIGVMSLILATYANQGWTCAIEAGKSNFDFLELNIKNNNIKNCHLFNIGVGDISEIVDFNYVPQVAGCSFISPSGVKEGISEKVQLENLLTIAKMFPKGKVNLVKIDVEGGERRVLSGAKNFFLENQPYLIIEFNPTPIKRFYNENPLDLYIVINEIYNYIYIIPENINEKILLVENYEFLDSYINRGKGWEDLVCSFTPLI